MHAMLPRPFDTAIGNRKDTAAFLLRRFLPRNIYPEQHNSPASAAFCLLRPEYTFSSRKIPQPSRQAPRQNKHCSQHIGKSGQPGGTAAFPLPGGREGAVSAFSSVRRAAASGYRSFASYEMHFIKIGFSAQSSGIRFGSAPFDPNPPSSQIKTMPSE